MPNLSYNGKRLLFPGGGILNYTYQSPPILQFTTSSYTPDTFDPYFTVESGTLEWDLGDNTTENSNSFTHTYTQSGNKTVKVFEGTTSGVDSINYIELNEDSLEGTIDISNCTSLNSFNVRTNPNLTSIINPTTSSTFIATGYRADYCNLTGEIDISGLSGLGGTVAFSSNPNLTSIKLPTTSNSITNVSIALTGIETLDLSGFSNVNGQLNLYSNTSLTGITMPAGGTLRDINLYGCNLSGEIDMSHLTSFVNGSGLRFGGSSNITSILWPTTADGIDEISAYGTSITELNITGLTNLYGQMQFGNCFNLSTVNFPASIGAITNFNFSTCSLSGQFDLSMVSSFSGGFQIQGNAITDIVLPASNGDFSYMYVNGNNLQGDLDLSSLNSFPRRFYGYSNTGMTSITLPSFTQEVVNINLNNCALNQTTIDGILSGLNTYFTSNTPDEELIVNLGGGTNSSPTDGASNSDLLSLETIFTNAGQTLTATINT